jgi:glucose-6-phosphate dehydrogenase assembly protein OpcA
MSARTVPLQDVERELARQLTRLRGHEEPVPVLRARLSNLIVFCGSAAQWEAIDAQVPEFCAAHPARVLLLFGDRAAPDAPVTAEASVRPINVEQRQFSCAEEVTLRAGGSDVDRLPFAVRPFLVSDLPVNVLWAAPVPPPLAGPLLQELAENAQQIIYDSIGWPDPARGVAATAGWLEQVERSDAVRWRVASDLNWRRLKYWRRVLRQALAPESAPGAAESANEVVVEHGPHASVQAWLLASWLARRMRWRVGTGKVTPNVEMVFRCDTPAGPARARIHRLEQGSPEIRRVRIACRLGNEPAVLNVGLEDGRRLAIHLEGVPGEPRTLTLPHLAPVELVGRQLSDRERDPVFRECMAVAGVMARGLLA